MMIHIATHTFVNVLPVAFAIAATILEAMRMAASCSESGSGLVDYLNKSFKPSFAPSSKKKKQETNEKNEEQC